ncbi:nucleotide exchange factor GrpE [Streptomyces sp. NPDC020965]|uniref:nucleotide exchange factor GrpE n=1 Tax=Streptomyces sp. NPDC020965 TaxID=3365105 RepID=UPI00379A990A
MSDDNRDRPAGGTPPHGPPPTSSPEAAPESPPELWRDTPESTAPAAPPVPPEYDPAELTDRWRRALADLDNLRKRHARDLPRELAAERARVAAAWLPVVDNLELALAHADAEPGAVVSGVRAVRDQAVDVLKGLGYPRDDETGIPFDPQRHDVVSVVDSADTAPGTVVQMMRPGYGEPGRQLRPATVTVSRKPE